MKGLDLNKPINFIISSLRFFNKGERHVTRVCPDDVLLLVYEGVLRFSEDGQNCEVRAGEYYIQHSNSLQVGNEISDSPRYLYVHFLGTWGEGEGTLPKRGHFNTETMLPVIFKLDKLSHGNYSYIDRSAIFYSILSELSRAHRHSDSPAGRIASYLSREYLRITSLDELCEIFHYSKNHIINIFRTEYGVTPFEYINDLKIKRAMYLLEVTSASIEEISRESGFNHYSHFYRLFVKKNGIPPLEWRNKIKIHPILNT